MTFQPTRVLVTGGAGFVGSHLCQRLCETYPSAAVVALDNLHRRGSELQVSRLYDAGVEFVHGDVRNVEDISRTGDVDLIIEAAAETSVLAGVNSDPGYVVRSNVVGTANCLEFARRQGAAFVFLSTSRVYPIERLRQFELRIEGERFELVNPHELRGVTERGVNERFPLDGHRTLYGATKLASEQIAGEFFSMYGIPGIINRCGVVAGPWQMARVDQGVVGLWCSRHLFGGPLAYIGYGGYQVRDAVHVADLADLIMKQIQSIEHHSGAIFNVGGGRSVSFSLRELTSLCAERVGRPILIEDVQELRQGDVPLYLSDSSLVQETYGWVPVRGMAEIVDDTVAWLERHADRLRPVFAS